MRATRQPLCALPGPSLLPGLAACVLRRAGRCPCTAVLRRVCAVWSFTAILSLYRCSLFLHCIRCSLSLTMLLDLAIRLPVRNTTMVLQNPIASTACCAVVCRPVVYSVAGYTGQYSTGENLPAAAAPSSGLRDPQGPWLSLPMPLFSSQGWLRVFSVQQGGGPCMTVMCCPVLYML